MRIRRAAVEDARELTALVLRAKAHWGYSGAQMQAWRPELQITEETLGLRVAFVAEVDGHIIGFYSLAPSTALWELDDLWVLPSVIRTGVGRTLLAHAAHTAATGGAASIRIESDPHAEPFYLACGAKRIGAVAAAIEGEPDRVRPVLQLAVPDRG